MAYTGILLLASWAITQFLGVPHVREQVLLDSTGPTEGWQVKGGFAACPFLIRLSLERRYTFRSEWSIGPHKTVTVKDRCWYVWLPPVTSPISRPGPSMRKLAALGQSFREAPRNNRVSEWEAIFLPLVQKLQEQPPAKPRTFIVSLLGEPRAAVVAQCEETLELDLENRGPIKGHLLAYQLSGNGNIFIYMAIDLRQPADIKFIDIGTTQQAGD